MRLRKYRFLLSVLIAGFLFATCLLSCQKEIHINLESAPPTLVVEGYIENGVPPYVFLTNTISFFATVDLKTLENSFIHNAVVTISDGSKTVTLKEYSLDTAGGNKIYVYSAIDTSNLSYIMKGELGKSYQLTILYNNKTYTSTTTIPHPKGLDSLWFAEPTFKNSRTAANAVQLFADYTDPDTIGNYVRYFTKRNREGFFSGQIFSDEIINGKRIPNIGLFAGYAQVTDAKRDSLIYFYPGDSVSLKWCEIDRGVYTFWNTFQFANNAIGNPFSTPINITSNISGGAQGLWAGYGSIEYRLAVPK